MFSKVQQVTEPKCRVVSMCAGRSRPVASAELWNDLIQCNLEPIT
jgi:hypothetical protein